ncbi:deoxyguanosinetriphosphate triphosphohydrolase [Candidatus Poribacteria bacterium]|nr:deoxyguanosinetriphosphate triphosphohydrolase [Candidatus Poribacteria bacterium]
MLTRLDHEAAENANLAPYATRSSGSLGRAYEAEPDPFRTDFQRDRDRIIHSTAFRKLEFKTQVFGSHAGDYYRSRMTHSVEVAQIARTLARALNLNSDLAEAIALGHDLGHTPFGHAGEAAMRECMEEHGGFEHNAQGLRVVEFLEERSPRYPGLNLTYEVREGIIKHDTAYDSPDPHPAYNPGKAASLESQVCDLADEIAYNNADLDDALKMGLIAEADLAQIEWVWEHFRRTREAMPAGVRDKFVKYKALGALYDAHVHDALEFSQSELGKSRARSIEDVHNHAGRLADFSPGFKVRLAELKNFLLHRVYFHPQTMVYSNKARKFVREMFNHYLVHQNQLPWKYQERIADEGSHRVICDYIAGMTDRYLMEQYQASFMPEVVR